MRPIFGGRISKATQITRITVTSVSKYSANPLQTPAIFFPAAMRRSLRGAAEVEAVAPVAGAPMGLPQEVQNRAESASWAPHCVQNILADSIKTRWSTPHRQT
jgi:hypothetical protein